MAEGTRLNTLHEQVQGLRNQLESLKAAESSVPKWWEEQRKSIDAKLTENQGYISRMLELMMQRSEIQAPAPVESGTINHSGNVQITPMPQVQAKKDGKNPVEVTVIDERGKYTYKPEEPGLLPKMQLENSSQQTQDSFKPAKGREFN